MIVLPIVDRELRVAARRPATYRTRLWAAMAAMALAAWKGLEFAWQGASAASQGQSLFYLLSGLAMVYCLGIGARVTSDCVSEEKREGTLGLLFLTDLKGMDVVLGKMAASSLNSFYGLLAVLPLLALPLLLGGVTLSQFGHMVVVLLNALFFSLSMGMLVSALSRNDRKAMFGTLLTVFGVTLLPYCAVFFMITVLELVDDPRDVALMLPFVMVNPIYPFLMALPLPMLPFTIAPSTFWLSVAAIHALSWGALLIAARILPVVWKDRSGAAAPGKRLSLAAQWLLWAYGNALQRKEHRIQLLSRNPFLWLVSRDRLKPAYAWFFLLAMVAVWLTGYVQHGDVMFDFYPLVPTVMLVHCFLKVWVVSEVSHRLVEDQRNGALELLLSTPLTAGEITRGQQMALVRQFAKPVLALCVMELVVFQSAFPVLLILPVLLMLVADLFTLMWVSLRLSLSARSINEVLLKSLAWVLVLPWVVYLIAWPVWEWTWGNWHWFQASVFQRPGFGHRVYFWFAIGLFNNAFWIFYWARPEWAVRLKEASARVAAGASQRARKWNASALKSG